MGSPHQAHDETPGYIVFEPRFRVTDCINNPRLSKEGEQCENKEEREVK